jgi:hypothetical protein
MTFIPSALIKIDDNNTTTTTGTNYSGAGTLTTGYNSVIVTLSSNLNSNPGGLEIQYSSDGVDGSFITFYNDTYFTGTKFTKTYKIINKYYRIKYTTSSSSSADFTITSRLNIDESQEQSNINNIYSLPQDGMYDAFGKLRVSNPYTLLDIKFPSASTGTADYLNNNMLLCSGSTGGGTGTYGSSECVMSANGGTGTFISQSRKYCTYQPGKSILFLGSGIIGPTGISSGNYTNRLGYFNDENGLFFEHGYSGGVPGTTGTMSVVLRNTPAGTTAAINTFIPQSNWNIDKLDGSGNSGITLDFTKAQLFVIDFEWLSVGRIRYGFYIYGKIFYCHQITNVNGLTAPYMITPNLPIRYEVRNNGSTGNVSLTQICSSVITEGGYNPIGKPFSINNGTIPVTLSDTTEILLLAIRGNMTNSSNINNRYNHENILPTNLNILAASSTNIVYYIRLYLAPNIANTGSDWTWSNVNSNSITQYIVNTGSNITNFTTTNSILVGSGYLSNNSIISFGSLSDIFSNLIQITSNITNQSDIITISALKLSGGTTTAYASLDWTEIY